MNREGRCGVERVIVVVRDHERGIIYGQPVQVVVAGDVVAERETNLDGMTHFDLGRGEYIIFAIGENRRVRIPGPESERHLCFTSYGG